MRRPEFRIDLDSSLVGLLCSEILLLVSGLTRSNIERKPLKVSFVSRYRCGACRDHVSQGFRIHRDLKCARYFDRQVLLDGDDVVWRAVIGFRPQVESVRSLPRRTDPSSTCATSSASAIAMTLSFEPL